jgi:hypothetical protein
MPRYAMDADTVWPHMIAVSNLFEYNIMDGSSLETSDSGAMEFTGQGAMRGSSFLRESSPWSSLRNGVDGFINEH